jgi:hypothetical protein
LERGELRSRLFLECGNVIISLDGEARSSGSQHELESPNPLLGFVFGEQGGMSSCNETLKRSFDGELSLEFNERVIMISTEIDGSEQSVMYRVTNGDHIGTCSFGLAKEPATQLIWEVNGDAGGGAVEWFAHALG